MSASPPSAPAPGKRSRRKQHTRAAIVAAGMTLFAEHGFEAVTADAIAAAAGVSRSTFFRYFPTKEAVVFADQSERLERFEALIAANAETLPPFDALRASCLALVGEYVARRGELMAVQAIIDASPLLSARERDADRAWEDVIVNAFTRAAATSEQRRRAMVRGGAVFGAIRATLRAWFDEGGDIDLIAHGQEAFELLAEGIG